MKKFRVTLYYHTNCTVEVEAENESDAVKKRIRYMWKTNSSKVSRKMTVPM
ncbi:MAG: hypothetical protein PUB73_06275 [Bacteroidales bacterium]|nr:hypothetical protein [Bacteroidales bacterium]